MIKKILNSSILMLALFLLNACTDDNSTLPDYIKEGEYVGEYFPTNNWRECSPESVGISSEKLKAVYDYCASEDRNSYSFLIIKDGYIIAEKYFQNFSQSSKIHSYSLAKSFTAALTGIAIQKGYINSIEDKISDYFPELQEENTDPLKKEINIKHLLTMTSGYQWEENEISFARNDLYNIRQTSDYIQYVLDKPMETIPGTDWNYSSGNPLLLGGIIENTTDITTFDFANQTLFSDLGIKDVEWSSDESGSTIAAWGLSLKSRDYAKLGYLYWKNGIWDTKQVLPDYWVNNTQKPALESTPHYGYLFWLAYRYDDHVGTQVPEDTYMATGLFQKYIIIIPSYDLVLVRLGEDLVEGEYGWDTAEFISLVIDAVDNQ
ncbi:MAG: serine hydrolase [Bacteroidales bacterium]|nr:serine hydrolase [Bacteroidales bacterium]